MTGLDADACYRALLTRDARFDGRFFVAVTTTGIYCRPVCPATTAKRNHCRFFPSAAAAALAGFRPCLRCRPETAPEHPAWHGTSSTVSRALALISAGELDGHANVERLAARLGVGERHLRRLFDKHLGASPVAVAQTRRVLFAKQLIHETSLKMGDIAFAAGFGSVRRFNETFQSLYGKPPSALRRRSATMPEAGVTVRLRYRPPYDWHAMLAFLGARALAGVERVEDCRYLRTFREDGELGSVEVSHLPASASLAVTIRGGAVRALPRVVHRVRRVFDLGADTAAIGAHLASDPLLAPLVRARPGLRVAGGWDGFELGVRAVLGQQVSLAAARTLGSKLCVIAGEAALAGSALTRLFPTAEALTRADLAGLGVPRARLATLKALARAALADPALFEPGASVAETVARLMEIPGVGVWTAEYVALRAAREPDAFPLGDRGLERGFSLVLGRSVESSELVRRSARWRPFRAYAAEHLWAADAAASEPTEARHAGIE
jgi:AraC family transcriptional regulator of adaptative response / DNA-3-methyladenine glycosylase II